jgi:hypothetical protein
MRKAKVKLYTQSVFNTRRGMGAWGLSPYGGWHGGCGNEQWTSRVTHTGDGAPFPSYDERFGHPARTWASSSHRKFTHAAVGIAMAAATFRFMQVTAKAAMRRVLGKSLRGEQGETFRAMRTDSGGRRRRGICI